MHLTYLSFPIIIVGCILINGYTSHVVHCHKGARKCVAYNVSQGSDTGREDSSSVGLHPDTHEMTTNAHMS